MRAHFAGDVVDVAPSMVAGTSKTINNDDSIDKIEEHQTQHEDESRLDSRIDDFKRDSKNMEILSEFIDDVLQKAEVEAAKQQNAKNKKLQQTKEKSRQSFAIPDFKNGKVVNRARGLVVRIFDWCIGTAAAPAQRMKLRGGKKNSAAAAGNDDATSNGDGGGGDKGSKDIQKETKSKKQHENNKDKKKEDKQKNKNDKNAAEVAKNDAAQKE